MKIEYNLWTRGKQINAIEGDKTSAEVVKKYQCLYDKSIPRYKERDQYKNAWKAVDKEIGLMNISSYRNKNQSQKF